MVVAPVLRIKVFILLPVRHKETCKQVQHPSENFYFWGKQQLNGFLVTVNMHELTLLDSNNLSSISAVKSQGSRPALSPSALTATHFLQTFRVLLSTIWGAMKEDEKEGKR